MGLWQAEALHNCRHCRAQGLQQHRGCPELGAAHPGHEYLLDGEIVRHCLVSRVTPASLEWLNLYSYVNVGLLPETGGLNDQYEIDLMAFMVIGGEMAALQAAQRERKHGR